MTKGLLKKEYLPIKVLGLVAFLAASILLYFLNPIKGLSWVLIYLFQAGVSFLLPYFAIFHKSLDTEAEIIPFTGANELRLAILRHVICQVCIFILYCLLGLFSHAVLGEKSGVLSLILVLFFTCLIEFFSVEGYVFNKGLKPLKAEKFLIKYDLYLYAFLIPIAFQLLLFSIYEVYPFGDQVYLRMDCYHQYAPFLKEFYLRMHNGSGLFFAWENGLGVNYWAHFAYYLSSPLNLIILLLPQDYILEGISAGIIIKSGLASVAFLYYLNAKWKERNVLRLAFAVFYGLSAYMLAYSCNIMWPETYILFPLIMLGVERIAKGEGSKLYGVALALSVITNFYITIIAGIAIVLYFVANLIIHAKEGNVFLKIGRFIWTTFVVLLCTAIILLPVYLCLKATPAGAFEFPEEVKFYFGFHELFGRMLVNTNTIQNNSDLPNIYGSVLALLLLFYFFANKKISLKSKITKGILVLFLLFSFQVNVLDYVWHGFHFPNSFPARQSFFFIFLLLSMGAECYEKKDGIGKIEIISVASCMIVGCIVLWFFLSKDDLVNGLTTYLCSALLLLLYGAMIYLSNYTGKRILKVLILAVAMIECLSNTLAVGINSTVSRTDYVKDEAITEKTIAYLDEQNQDINAGFYRIEEYNRKFMNEAAWNGYKGASYFSSTISGGVKEFYENMGLRHSDVAYSFQGSSPFLTSFFGIKYILTGKEEAPGETFKGSEMEDGDETIYVYENLYPLSVGFAVPNGVDEKLEIEEKHPFRNQNAFASLLLEEEDVMLYKKLPPYGVEYETRYKYNNDHNSVTGTGTVYHVPAGRHAFFYVVNYVDAIRVVVQDEDRNTIDSKKETDLKFRHIIDVGVYDEDRYIVFVCEDDHDEELSFQAYCFQEDIYYQLMDKLSADELSVESYSNTGLKGTVTCSRDETLLFSIPYDEGFTMLVDGEKVKPEAFAGAFLSIPLSAGEHNVEISYIPPGFIPGLLISIAGIVITALSLLFSHLLKTKKEAKKQA